MPMTTADDLSHLYRSDETEWLKAMAALAMAGRYEEMDFEHLAEYLTDMAKRDEREVFNRLVVLLCHLLKWAYQPDQRTNSWRGTIREQRRELIQLLESGSLRNHAETILAEAYEEARLQAADETGLNLEVFPADDSRNLDHWMGESDSNSTDSNGG